MITIGQGIDYHKIIEKKNNQIKLGGYSFNSNYTIVAHSDGDLVLHSISNAILGALCCGDIGEYFKDTDIQNKNIDSKKILDFCLEKLNGRKIVNIDLTIICEKIILKDIKNHIKESLKALTKCENINIKATRFEQPDCMMIGCHSVILVD